MTIYDYDNDFAHYECDKDARKKMGQVWTPYSIIEKMMDKLDNEIWKDEKKTALDPTMGSGNIVIGILYRRIVENKQDPLAALKNTYGVELELATCEYAKNRLAKFMKNFTDEDCSEIINHNFVCSDIFEWDCENWCKKQKEEKTPKVKKGRHWYNNGVSSVLTNECPPGFTRGKLKRKEA
jgi:type I restriction-modification system DNA methylase subunit